MRQNPAIINQVKMVLIIQFRQLQEITTLEVHIKLRLKLLQRIIYIFYRSGSPERTELKICGVWSVPWGRVFDKSSTSNFASSSDSTSSFWKKNRRN